MIFLSFQKIAHVFKNVSNQNKRVKFTEGYFSFQTFPVKTCRMRNIATSPILKERKFSKYHTWILAEDKEGIVGLSNFAQKRMDEFVYIELPSIGRECKMNEPCGTLESIRAVIDLFCPVSGVVFEKNTVEDLPRLVNQSCYEKGWLFKVKLTQLNELNKLMNEAEYEDYIKKNFRKM